MSDKMAECVKKFFHVAHKNKANTPQEMNKAFSEHRFTMYNGVIFYISDELAEAAREARKVLLKKHGVEVISEKEISDLLYKYAACLSSEENIKEHYKNFSDDLNDVVNIQLSFVAPNFSVQLRDGVDSLSIGKVQCIRTSDLANNVPKIHQQIIPNDGMDLGMTPEFTKGGRGTSFHVGLSPQAFIINLIASPKNAEQRARWYADVAVSLVRLFFAKAKDIGKTIEPCPNLGDTDPLLFELRDSKDKHLIVSDKQTSHCGGGQLQMRYVITCEIKEWLDQSNFSEVAEKIFSCTEGTVAEKMQRALGWMSRARSTASLPERFLFFFTALEALLTRSDKDAPVTETISRHVATILSDPEKRFFVYSKMKSLYSLRSKMVHSGLREVSVSDCNQLQYYTEIVCAMVIDNCLDQKTEEFQNALREAGFGSEWPVKA